MAEGVSVPRLSLAELSILGTTQHETDCWRGILRSHPRSVLRASYRMQIG